MNKHISATSIKPVGMQLGMVLPVVLIFLLIMTAIGIAAIRNVTLEEKMAGNSRNHQLAFQAAEEALRFCERIVLDTTNTNKFYKNQPKPWYRLATVETNATKYWLYPGSKWSDANYVPPGGVVAKTGITDATDQLAERPKCMVERLEPGSSATAEGGSMAPPSTTCPYRITARGVGMDANTVVLLQSYLIAPSGAGNVCEE